MNKVKYLQEQIASAFDLLKEKKLYTQREVVDKMRGLGAKVSYPLFSNILGKRRVNIKSLNDAFNSIKKIIEIELGLEHKEEKWIELPDWISGIVPIVSEPSGDGVFIKATEHPFTFFPDGRLSIPEKVAFLKSAKLEIIEVGVRLKAGIGYYETTSSATYRDPIDSLLLAGVHFHFYLLDSNSNRVQMFLEDRAEAKALENELEALEDIRKNITKLQHLRQRFIEKNHPGGFHIYTYQHIPSSHFVAIDPQTEDAQIMVTHYLYGVPRSDCPVVICSKRENPILYKKYKSSMDYLIADAKDVSDLKRE